jgi:hypothetical protein
MRPGAAATVVIDRAADLGGVDATPMPTRKLCNIAQVTRNAGPMVGPKIRSPSRESGGLGGWGFNLRDVTAFAKLILVTVDMTNERR